LTWSAVRTTDEVGVATPSASTHPICSVTDDGVAEKRRSSPSVMSRPPGRAFGIVRPQLPAEAMVARIALVPRFPAMVDRVGVPVPAT
jgi:hypothetical protein